MDVDGGGGGLEGREAVEGVGWVEQADVQDGADEATAKRAAALLFR